MTVYVNDNTVPGTIRVHWQERGKNRPMTDGRNYRIEKRYAEQLVADAAATGSHVVAFDVEHYPGPYAERLNAAYKGVRLIRSALGDAWKDKEFERPIFVIGLDHHAHSGRRILEALPIYRIAGCILIGCYVQNGPNRVVDGVPVGTSIEADIDSAIATKEFWTEEARTLPQVVAVQHQYIYADNHGLENPQSLNPPPPYLSLPAKRRLADRLKPHFPAAFTWTPGAPDMELIDAFR